MASRAYCIALSMRVVAELSMACLLCLNCKTSHLIGEDFGFRQSRISQETSQESFQKERFGLLGSVSRKRPLTSENVPKCYAAFCVLGALSRRRSPVRIRSELPETPVQSRMALNFFLSFSGWDREKTELHSGGCSFDAERASRAPRRILSFGLSNSQRNG